MGVGGDREKESSEKMVPVLLKMKWKCRHYWFYVFRFLNITDKIFFSSSPSKKKKSKWRSVYDSIVTLSIKNYRKSKICLLFREEEILFTLSFKLKKNLENEIEMKSLELKMSKSN